MDALSTRMMIARKGSTLRTDFFNGIGAVRSSGPVDSDVLPRTIPQPNGVHEYEPNPMHRHCGIATSV